MAHQGRGAFLNNVVRSLLWELTPYQIRELSPNQIVQMIADPVNVATPQANLRALLLSAAGILFNRFLESLLTRLPEFFELLPVPGVPVHGGIGGE